MAVRTTQLSEQAVRVPEGRVSRGRAWTVRDSVALSSRRTLAGAAAVAAAAIASAAGSDVTFSSALALVALIPAALVDIIEHRLPNRLVALAAPGASCGLLLDTAIGHGHETRALASALLLGAVVMAAPVLAVHLISPVAMGFGDVKLAVALGAALGTVSTTLPLVALALGCAFSAAVGLVRRRRSVAFGPGLLVGAVAALALVALSIDLVDPLPSSAFDTTDIRSAISRAGTR